MFRNNFNLISLINGKRNPVKLEHKLKMHPQYSANLNSELSSEIKRPRNTERENQENEGGHFNFYEGFK
jgi:hypothetical protein